MIDFAVNLLAFVGAALIVAGVALVSIPAALIVGGALLMVLAFGIARADEHRKRTVE